MRKIILLAAVLCAIPNVKAQKKEIKKAHQEVKAGNLASASSYLHQAKRIFAAADSKTRAEYYVVEAEMTLAEKQLDLEQIELISQSIQLANKYEITPSLEDRISQINQKIKGLSATIAAGEFTAKNYSSAATLYKTAHQSSGDNMHLVNAAKSHLLAKEYSEAYEVYRNLITLGFTNAKTQYVATNVSTGKKEAFSTESKRDEAIAAGVYRNPEIITSNSKLPEILRGLTVSAIPLNKNHEAVTIIEGVVAGMPKNIKLLNQVSHFYKQLEAHDKFNAVVDLLIKETPNNPNLYYNAAVASEESNDLERAKKLYKKALVVDPNYINAHANLSLLLLEEDKVITDEMNALGTSEEDDKRYEKLKQRRVNLYYEVLPYLQQIVKSNPKDEDFSKKLSQIKSFIGNDPNSAVAQEKLDDQ